MKKIGIVIPAYKESENIIPLCEEILLVCPSADILVVDDSPDNSTVDIVKSSKLSKVTIIHRKEKGGRGTAVISGISRFLERDFDIYIEMDADFSHQPSEIPALISHADKNSLDLLIAARYLPQSKIINWPISRRIFSRTANIIAKLVLKVPVCDYTNGFRLYNKPAAKIIVNNCGHLGTGFISLSEVLVNIYYNNLRVGEIPTQFINRIRGESSLSYKEILSALVGLMKIYKLKKNLTK